MILLIGFLLCTNTQLMRDFIETADALNTPIVGKDFLKDFVSMSLSMPVRMVGGHTHTQTHRLLSYVQLRIYC